MNKISSKGALLERQKKTKSTMEDIESTSESASASTPLVAPNNVDSYQSTSTSDESSEEAEPTNEGANNAPENFTEADILARKLMACNDNDDLEQYVIHKSLGIPEDGTVAQHSYVTKSGARNGYMKLGGRRSKKEDESLFGKMVTIISLALLGLLAIFVLLQVSSLVVGPPSEPIGPYKLVEVQEGEDFFDHYTFYDGPDSEGSKGYINYVDKQNAHDLNIANVTWENVDGNQADGEKEPFVYMNTAATADGPRHSIRLEGLRRFNRGLFIIDLRHMPAGCASWPAFWMSDEAGWPINGEIDIVEGVNTQTSVKTALHTTEECTMFDVPLGTKTGYWDTAQGVPKQNGDIDYNSYEARNCWVYGPHQWLNQGCVAISDDDESIGTPLNKKGGGVFVMEWDPVNRLIKSWAFAPHAKVPDNLKEALDSANDKRITKKVMPDPATWGLPYAYFPIGEGTSCAASHFSNMHLIFNTALCGSVAGQRFFMDCPELKKKYGTCENYVKADTPEMKEMYWKVRGVYVYERGWERSWLN